MAAVDKFEATTAGLRFIPHALELETLNQSGTALRGVEGMIDFYAQVASANRAKLAKLRIVLSQFHKHGINCILLKGADLIPRLYRVWGLRPMADIDLLVHEYDLPVIDVILCSLGYHRQIDGNPAYACPDGILVLDLITMVWYLDDQEAIWRRAVTRTWDGVEVKGMGTNDLFLYLTAYAVVHRGWLSPSVAQDLSLLIEKERVDWDFVLNEASQCHLKIPMYHGLSLMVTRHAGVPIPDYVLRRLAPSTLSETLCFWFFQKLATEKPVAEMGHLLLFITQPGLKKSRWLRDRFFPSESFMKYRYGDKWKAYPLTTRLSRPFYLLFQAIRLFIRVA